jgi:Kef-type K+ transport system membrane component KefB
LIASFASIVFTFLAGMEVDPAYLRRRLEASVGIGVVSFTGPFVVASLVAYLAASGGGLSPDDRQAFAYSSADRESNSKPTKGSSPTTHAS